MTDENMQQLSTELNDAIYDMEDLYVDVAYFLEANAGDIISHSDAYKLLEKCKGNMKAIGEPYTKLASLIDE